MSEPVPHHISVQRTARYFTLGKLDERTEEIWLVLHGYAQLAAGFITAFGPLNTGSRFFVAPEGLSRFYARGFGGTPAASWMTSEDRENEIRDYVAYLDALYRSFDIKPHVKVFVLGFSQGVATASRFIHHTRHRVDRFWVCSGELAAELTDPVSERIRAIPLTYITGKTDPLITPEKHRRVYDLMHELQAEIVEFDGGHELHIASVAGCL